MPFVSRVSARCCAPLALACAMLVAPRLAAAAWPPDPLQNVPLCTTAFSSQIGSAIPDARGGAIAVWYEDRGGDFDVFARRVDSNGTPQWAANGVTVCVAPAGTSQLLPKAVSDGAGGVIVTWLDGRSGPLALYAQHVDSSGVLQWAAAGVLLATTASNQVTEFSVIADGAGGVVVAWATPASGVSSDIYAQRLNATGARQWGTNAKALCTNKFRPGASDAGAQDVGDVRGGVGGPARHVQHVRVRTGSERRRHDAVGRERPAARGLGRQRHQSHARRHRRGRLPAVLGR